VCHWEAAHLSDPDAPEGQIQVPALVCEDAARNELTRFEPAEFPWEKTPRPHDCAFRPAEIITHELDPQGRLATRVIEPETPAAILHLKEYLKRLSRGETPVCLAPERASVIRSALNPPAPSPAPSPAPQAPPRAALRRLDEQFGIRLRALEKVASAVCVVVDHSESMTPHLETVVSLFKQAPVPVGVNWTWIDSSTPHSRTLQRVRSNYPGVLAELGTHREGSSIERITESIRLCHQELLAPPANRREVWVISDEADLPEEPHLRPDHVRQQLERASIALQFLDPLHERCPTVARAGLKDSTRAQWLRESVARSARHAGLCSTEIARAASLGYLGRESWQVVTPLLEHLELEARTITLISALRERNSAIPRARALALAGAIEAQMQQISRAGDDMGLGGTEQQETEESNRQLLRQLKGELAGAW